LVIAEIGINHEGSVQICARLVEEAARAGADSIKLQTVDPDENYAPGSESHALFSRSGLTPEETSQIFSLARDLGVEPFTTTGANTLPWVERLEPAAYKVSSSLFSHVPLMNQLAQTGRTLLVSTGMNGPEDISAVVELLQTAGTSAFGLFQCTSLYPAPPGLLNIAVIRWLEDTYAVPAGFSDHSIGIEASILSIGAGARMVEKHFTLDTNRPSFDHAISVEPRDFKRMVDGIRLAEKMMGDGHKQVYAEQAETANRMQRYLVAAHDLKAGVVLTVGDIAVMRLQHGQSGMLPKYFDRVVGTKLAKDLQKFAPVREEFLHKDSWPL